MGIQYIYGHSELIQKIPLSEVFYHQDLIYSLAGEPYWKPQPLHTDGCQKNQPVLEYWQ